MISSQRPWPLDHEAGLIIIYTRIIMDILYLRDLDSSYQEKAESGKKNN